MSPVVSIQIEEEPVEEIFIPIEVINDPLDMRDKMIKVKDEQMVLWNFD